MNKQMQKIIYMFFIFLMLYVSHVFAVNNFIPFKLPKGVVIELPRNWTILSNNQRITIDSFIQTETENMGFVDYTREFAFAANYFDDAGNPAGILNIQYFISELTQADVREATPADIKKLKMDFVRVLCRDFRWLRIKNRNCFHGTVQKNK